MMAKILVALPAYNEAPYIGDIVRKIREKFDDVLVLDDGSTDDTACVATEAGATVHTHGSNKGYGATVQSILQVAVLSDPDVLVVLDADDQHSPEDIPALVKAITDGYDLAIGHRSNKDIPPLRRVGGTVLSIATRLLSGVKIMDSQCGFRAYSRRAVTLIEPEENGMAVSSEIIALAAWNKLHMIEVPISVKYMVDSSTHNPWKQGVYTLWRVVVMLVQDKFFTAGEWFLIQVCYVLRRWTHWMRMRHISNGRDWRFYEQYSIREILKMKVDGTEEDKYWAWLHWRNH